MGFLSVELKQLCCPVGGESAVVPLTLLFVLLVACLRLVRSSGPRRKQQAVSSRVVTFPLIAA